MLIEYKAVTPQGKKIQGLIEAKDVAEASGYLRARKFFPVVIRQKTQMDIAKFLPILGKVTRSDIVLFTRQLSSMLSSGLTLLRCLQILKEQMENRAMVAVITSIISDIEDGKSFSAAIGAHPKVFSHIYISLVKASEVAGVLDKSLSRLADTLEKQQKLSSSVKAALFYPAIVVTLMVVVMVLMLIFVIPQLAVLYKSLNVALPLPTQIIIGLSNIVIVGWPFLIGFIVIGGYVFRRWHKTENGKLIVDAIILRMPIFGKLVKETILAEFSRTMSILIASGSLVVDSLMQTSEITGNIYYKQAISDVAKRVERGISVGDSLGAYTLFPSILVQLVHIGEETGKLDETLLKASEYFDNEVSQVVKTLTTAMEPAIMIILGIGVGFLVLSVILPIYSLTSAIQ